MPTSQRQVSPVITTSSCSDYTQKVSNIFHAMPPEFTVTLNDDKTVNIIIDGEQLYCNFTPDDLKEFVQDFIDSNTEN